MVDLELQIKSIQEKLQLLLKQQQVLQKENQKLKKELEKAAVAEKDKAEVVQSLQQQVDALKLGSSSSGRTEEEKASLEKRINMYLKEIDKCLALLNN